jgi:hypothetical protein
VSWQRGRPPSLELKGRGHDIAQTEVLVSSPVHQKLQVVEPHPGVGIVLSRLQPRRSEIAFNFNEIVEFAANKHPTSVISNQGAYAGWITHAEPQPSAVKRIIRSFHE